MDCRFISISSSNLTLFQDDAQYSAALGEHTQSYVRYVRAGLARGAYSTCHASRNCWRSLPTDPRVGPAHPRAGGHDRLCRVGEPARSSPARRALTACCMSSTSLASKNGSPYCWQPRWDPLPVDVTALQIEVERHRSSGHLPLAVSRTTIPRSFRPAAGRWAKAHPTVAIGSFSA